MEGLDENGANYVHELVDRFSNDLDPAAGLILLRAMFKDEAGASDLLNAAATNDYFMTCLLYTSPSPRDRQKSRMPSSA